MYTNDAIVNITKYRTVTSFRATTALLDIGLPVLDGYEVMRLLRELWSEGAVRFVVTTGYGQERDKERTNAASFDAQLVKPVNLSERANLLEGRDTSAI
jgi:CheY-like chemotaxis protein